MLDSNN